MKNRRIEELPPERVIRAMVDGDELMFKVVRLRLRLKLIISQEATRVYKGQNPPK